MDDNTPVPERGLIEQKGRVLTGLVATRIPIWPATPLTAELIEPIEAGGKMLLSYDVTSVADAAIACVASFEEIRAYNLAKLQNVCRYASGWCCLEIRDSRLGGTCIWCLGRDAGCRRSEVIPRWLPCGCIAWMSRPYLGDDNNTDVQILPDDKLQALVPAHPKTDTSLHATRLEMRQSIS
ncbi:hypothetical protein [Bradyrhizobium tunisiense]|uniref:hypothetical protein n=1 Tax=Bradyrhizobium tunisiense TaxID=3278709 RepID=UPI0035E00341